MTALYATPRKARVIDDGRIVYIHGYGQESVGDGFLAVVAIIEGDNGCMGSMSVDALQLDAPTAPQLGMEKSTENTKENKRVLETCPGCEQLKELTHVDANNNPVCFACWDESMPF